MAVQTPQASRTLATAVVDCAPGFVLSAAVALAAFFAAPYVGRALALPAMVLALVIGIALNPIASQPITRSGMAFCVRTVLRWAVALLSLRVALSEIAALGLATGLMIVGTMIVTLLSGFYFARIRGRQPGFGASVWTTSLSWTRRICAGFCDPMLTITTTSERTGHWIKMRRSLARFSEPKSLVHTQSLVDFITTTSGFRFLVHTTKQSNATIMHRR